MNTTANYQLNQWEAGDRVLRTDFNGDNTKIDAALMGANEKIDNSIATVNTRLDTSIATVNTSIAGVGSRLDGSIAACNGRIDTTASNAAGAVNTLRSETAASIAGVSARAGCQLIRSVVTTEAATTIRFQIDDINWSAWSIVHFLFVALGPGFKQLSVYCNGSGAAMGGGIYLDSKTASSDYTGTGLLTFSPIFEPLSSISGLFNSAGFSFNSSVQTLTTLRMVCPENLLILPGTTMKIWGVK